VVAADRRKYLMEHMHPEASFKKSSSDPKRDNLQRSSAEELQSHQIIDFAANKPPEKTGGEPSE